MWLLFRNRTVGLPELLRNIIRRESFCHSQTKVVLSVNSLLAPSIKFLIREPHCSDYNLDLKIADSQNGRQLPQSHLPEPANVLSSPQLQLSYQGPL